MLQLLQTATFKKNLKKYKHQKAVLKELEQVINLLINEEPIPAKYKNHKLVGDYEGKLELHLRPDDLLIYDKTDKQSITLMALGNHAELFG